MIVTSRPSLRTQTHLSYTCEPSRFVACGVAAKGFGIPLFEEHLGVGVHEACEPPNCVGGTICAVVVVPTGHLALVFIAARVQGDAEDGFVGGAVAKATLAIRGAVLDLVPGLQLEAFVTECWVSDGCLFIRVVEGDIVFVRRALSSSDGWHAAATSRGTCGRLRVDIVEDASGEPRVDETATGLKQGIVVHSNVLFQGLEVCAERGTPSGL